MTSKTIIDTGPLVGLIRADDQWSTWSRQQVENLSGPFLTCEPVLSEASYLLQSLYGGVEQLVELVEVGHIEVSLSISDEASRLKTLIAKYRDLPMSLADACLVRMSEKSPGAIIFTVDGDFSIYRRNRNERIPLISPFS